MTRRQPRYSKDEHARRGVELYERQVRPQVEAGNRDKIVGIDVDTGDFELADDTITVADRLLTRRPDAQIWFVRIGQPGVHRFGSRTPTRRWQRAHYTVGLRDSTWQIERRLCI